jgi:hypothetical protein
MLLLKAGKKGGRRDYIQKVNRNFNPQTMCLVFEGLYQRKI